MHSRPTILTSSALSMAVLSTVAGLAPTASHAASAGATRAAYGMVFALTNDPAGNAVVSYRRDAHGMLTMTGRTATGGRGATLQGAVVDRTASQGALAADRRHKMLYAVNPGSDTLTVFSVGDGGLMRKQVLPTNGRFPVSVAVSPDGMSVFVLNARGGGSIQGYRMSEGMLVMRRMWHRDLGLNTMTGTDEEFTHTPGQVGFGPDGRHLLVTTKAATHSILVWPRTADGRFPMKPTVNTMPGAVPFAFDVDMAGRLDVANAGTGTVATYGLRPGGSLVRYGQTATTGTAVCWVAVHDDLIVASNTGSNTVTSLRSRAGAPVRLGVMKTGMAPVDAAFSPDGSSFHLQTGATNMIETYRVSATGVLTKIDSDRLPGPAGSEGIVAW